jgi:hypothetical protein
VTTRSEHRAEALVLYDLTDAFQPAHPQRLALLMEAQLHATLAITAPESTGLKVPTLNPVADGLADLFGTDAPTTPKPPRKRAAAKKVAESKETDK